MQGTQVCLQAAARTCRLGVRASGALSPVISGVSVGFVHSKIRPSLCLSIPPTSLHRLHPPFSTHSSPGDFLSPCNLLFPLEFFILQFRGQWSGLSPSPSLITCGVSRQLFPLCAVGSVVMRRPAYRLTLLYTGAYSIEMKVLFHSNKGSLPSQSRMPWSFIRY